MKSLFHSTKYQSLVSTIVQTFIDTYRFNQLLTTSLIITYFC